MIKNNNGEIRVVHLEAVLMPNGELISAGKCVGKFNTHKQYIHEVEPKDSHKWICEECDYETNIDYDFLVESGNPICPEGHDMEKA